MGMAHHRMLVFISVLIVNLISAQNDENQSSRLSVAEVGQEVADVFMGAVWSRIAGSEFVGGVADVYMNKQDIYPEVQTSYGTLRGLASLTSRNKTPYNAFLGIPYAKPPVGNLRFQAPQEVEPWEGIRNATFERATCLTIREPNKGREDCLFLNIFIPMDPKDEIPKAVMVFIYGGAFMGGSSNASGYAPDFLLDKGVITITFNYRIGPLGFLSLQNKEVPGNAGLKDQVMALRWIKKNIEHFGGDKEKITIFGESAGSASVNYLVLSPLAKGLFNGAIMESGHSIASWAYTNPKTAVEKSFLLGQRTGCTIAATLNQTRQLYECLLETPATLLTRTQLTGLSFEELFALQPLAFVPTKEPDLPGAAISEHPMEYLRKKNFNKMPIIMGINTAEGLLLYPILRKLGWLQPGVLMTILGQDLTKLMPPELKYSMTEEQHKEVNKRMHKFYANSSTLSYIQFLQIISDTQFLVPMMRTAEYLASEESQVYLYQFSFDGAYSCYKTDEEMKHLNGTSHMDELGYLFNLGPMKNVYNHNDRSKPEEKVIDLMTQLWTDFAKTGQPTEEDIWPKYNTNSNYYCDIGETCQAKTSIQPDTIKFWNDIYQLVTGSRLLPE